MIRLSLAVVAVTLLLGASSCSRPATPVSRINGNSAKKLSESERCARGGMEAANDLNCKAAGDERLRNFINGGKADEHRGR